jgi:hypothetical protein
MPIYRLLRDTAYRPEHIAIMTAAFEDVCRELQLAEREDPLRDLVAKTIIQCAEKDDFDPIHLRDCAREALKA